MVEKNKLVITENDEFEVLRKSKTEAFFGRFTQSGFSCKEQNRLIFKHVAPSSLKILHWDSDGEEEVVFMEKKQTKFRDESLITAHLGLLGLSGL